MKYLTFFMISIATASYGQTSFIEASDSINKSRVISVSAGIGGVWSGSMIGLYQVWYKDIPKTKWHFFDDSKNWLQMDKVGHFYAAYKINQLSSDLFCWSGLESNKSAWIGSGISFGYQTTFEFFDAYSTEWGFSWADMLSNLTGTGIYLGQKLAWGEERIIPKFSYHPTDYATIRPNVLGSSFAESLLKDYNGQTYWLSVSPGTFIHNNNFPKWLCFSIGYSADEKLVGSESTYTDLSTNITYQEKREWLFSLDIDFSRLPIKRPWLKTIVKQLNYLKIPFPALIISDGKLQGHPFYF